MAKPVYPADNEFWPNKEQPYYGGGDSEGGILPPAPGPDRHPLDSEPPDDDSLVG